MNNIDKLSKRLANVLSLTRPLCFFDLETTGINVKKDRIVEIYVHKVMPDGSYDTYYSLVYPEMIIPQEAVNTHFITNEEVIGALTFEELKTELHTFIEGCDFAGYNLNAFDIPLLMEEFARTGIMLNHLDFDSIDVRQIYVRNEGRSLSDAYKFYTGEVLENAHAAETDVMATEVVLLSQFDRYDDLVTNVKDLHKYCNYDQDVLDFNKKFYVNPKDGHAYYNFGPSKGERCIDNKGFLTWMITKGDFPIDAINVAKAILDGKIK